MKGPALLVFFCLLLCPIAKLFAQNLESIGKSKPLTVTGGVSLSQIFYGASGIQARRDPYAYFASGSVNFSLYGWNVPVSFSVSNQSTSFQQPFNQYSMHPTYKWVTAHIGYASTSYSSYTVNGHVFLGAAVDLAPEGKWKVSALYGRFLRPVELDTLNKNSTPSFRRMGYGFKAAYGDAGNFVNVSLFHAKDQVGSIRMLPDSIGILPQENLVVGVAAGKTLFEHFVIKAEIASSAITRDIRAEGVTNDNVLANTGVLFRPRASSSYYKAIKTSVNYQFSAYSIGVGYERVDPQYRTLGAYYFNNDLENITLNGAGSILHGKMNVAFSAGTQHDNLDNSKVSTMRRIVGSLNVNYIPSQRLNLAASYSTFQTYTNIRSQFLRINQLTPYDNLDTLNFTQITKSATLTAIYLLSNLKERRQSVNVNVSVQDAADQQGQVAQNSGSKFYNVNAAYALSLVPKRITVSVAFNANANDSPGIQTRTYGPTASVTRSFLDKKLRATVSSSYNNAYANGQLINSIINGRINGSYSIKKKHNLNMSIVVVNRTSKTSVTAASITEFTGTLGYSYAFGIR